MTTLTTAAGTILLEELCDCVGDEDTHDHRCRCVWIAPHITAIEAEARAEALATQSVAFAAGQATARADLLDRLAAGVQEAVNPWRTSPGGPSAAAQMGYDNCRAAVLALIEEARK